MNDTKDTSRQPTTQLPRPPNQAERPAIIAKKVLKLRTAGEVARLENEGGPPPKETTGEAEAPPS